MTRIYVGECGRDTTTHRVYIVEATGRRPLPPRLDLIRHSLDGLSWGYGGSGPAQLALALVADAFHHWHELKALNFAFPPWFPVEPNPVEVIDRLSLELHQEFKETYITPMGQLLDWQMQHMEIIRLVMALPGFEQGMTNVASDLAAAILMVARKQ